MYLRILLNFRDRHPPLLVRQVRLVADQQHNHTFWTLLLQLLHPIINIHERLVIRNVIYYECADGAPVVRGGDGTISLLARGIPDLSFDRLIILRVDSFCGELDTDGCFAL